MRSTNKNTGCLGALLRLVLGGKEKETVTYPYRVRDDFLSPAELSMYHVLSTLVGTQAVILAKVRLADLFFVQQPQKHRAAFNRIAQRHVDFLLCGPKTMKPLLGIELDDASHARADRVKRDEFLNSAFAAASLPLVRIPAQRAYNTREIAAKINPYVEATAPQVAATVTPMPDTAGEHTLPTCQKCGGRMVRRTGTKGAHQGEDFYGCTNYPKCHTILPIEAPVEQFE